MVCGGVGEVVRWVRCMEVWGAVLDVARWCGWRGGGVCGEV